MSWFQESEEEKKVRRAKSHRRNEASTNASPGDDNYPFRVAFSGKICVEINRGRVSMNPNLNRNYYQIGDKIAIKKTEFKHIPGDISNVIKVKQNRLMSSLCEALEIQKDEFYFGWKIVNIYTTDSIRGRGCMVCTPVLYLLKEVDGEYQRVYFKVPYVQRTFSIDQVDHLIIAYLNTINVAIYKWLFLRSIESSTILFTGGGRLIVSNLAPKLSVRLIAAFKGKIASVLIGLFSTLFKEIFNCMSQFIIKELANKEEAELSNILSSPNAYSSFLSGIKNGLISSIVGSKSFNDKVQRALKSDYYFALFESIFKRNPSLLKRSAIKSQLSVNSFSVVITTKIIESITSFILEFHFNIAQLVFEQVSYQGFAEDKEKEKSRSLKIFKSEFTKYGKSESLTSGVLKLSKNIMNSIFG